MSSVSSDDDNKKGPQEALDNFWENLITKKPAKVTNIFPSSLYANLLPPQKQSGPAKGRNAALSYKEAAEECRARVKRIVRECHRTNEKFTDPEFDIENDLGTNNCLEGLMSSYQDPQPSDTSVSPWRLNNALSTLVESNVLSTYSMAVDMVALSKVLANEDSSGSRGPSSVHRVDWIFDNPSFTVDGYSSTDVKQGANGDCWFIAAVATICSNPGLMDKICVERDEECGVYGFVFYRDGEWIWTVIDDNLYLARSDFDAFSDDYDPTGSKERRYKKNYQTGSDALYFASCADQNETWLPLLEKAYAKVHGDYDAISGGISGEAVEDLTGGVTTKVLTNRILSKERLWNELLQVNKQFLFSASSPGSWGGDSEARQGIALNHAYSILKAVEEEDEEGKKHRLVLIRNPWGERASAGMGEWNGPWSDGSKEWTPYWMQKLNYRFGNDGIFWVSYDDLRKRFDLLDRTRLFNEDWTVVQHWASVSVAWVTGYLNTKFVVEIKKGGPTVFVLCQLDDRYFRGLEGKYNFDLHFVLQEENASLGDHIVRARGAWFGNRSISAEVDLKPGKYEVVPKIVATRSADSPDVYDVVTKTADRNPQKLRQIGMNYDIANAKGSVRLTAEEEKKKGEKKKAAEKKKRKEKEEAEKEKAEFEAWKKEKRERELKEKTEKEKAEEDKTKANQEVSASKLTAAKQVDEAKSEEKKAEEPRLSQSAEVQKATAQPNSKTTEPSKDAPKTAEDTAKHAGETSKPSETSSSDDSPTINTPGSPSITGRSPPQLAPPVSVYNGGFASNPPSPTLGPPQHRYYAASDVGAPAAPNPGSGNSEEKSWNAVCVLGLRVYSQDPEVSINLVKPKTAEEGALLDVDGVTQAGATMS